MPSKIVDLSARSKIIEAEPFGLHFWECKPEEFLAYLQDPRGVLASMGIDLPKDCRIVMFGKVYLGLRICSTFWRRSRGFVEPQFHPLGDRRASA